MSDERITGAAAHFLANKLLMEPYEFDDWNAAHERIADWHIDSKGHRVCGCEVHQAHCPDCHAPWIAAYAEETRTGESVKEVFRADA